MKAALLLSLLAVFIQCQDEDSLVWSVDGVSDSGTEAPGLGRGIDIVLIQFSSASLET